MIRTEVAISLTIAWNPTTALEPRDVPTVRNFLAAVKSMLRLPGNGVRLEGPVTMLEAAFDQALPTAEPDTIAPAPPETLVDSRVRALRNALTVCRGNRTRAAARLGVAPRTVSNLIHRHGLAIEFPPSCTPGPRAARTPELVS